MNFKSHLRIGALMIGLSLCGGLLTSAHAAPGGPGGKAGGKGGMRGGGMKMMKDLNLTDAQKAKLKPIMAAQMTQMKALRDNTTMDRPTKMAKMKAMRAGMEKQVAAILTPDQKKKLAAMQAQMKAQRQAERKANGGKGKGPQAPAA